MKVLFSPQLNTNDILSYEFKADIVIATLNGVSETFDFTGMPDGELDSVEHELPVNVLRSAKKESGVLYVEVLNYIGLNATEEERFPVWVEVVSVG